MRKTLLLAAWFSIMLAIYLCTEYEISKSGSYEIVFAFNIYSAIMTFPFGLLVPGAWFGAVYFFDGTFLGKLIEGSNYLTFFLFLAFLAVGYWQWFVLLPEIIVKIRNRKPFPKG